MIGAIVFFGVFTALYGLMNWLVFYQTAGAFHLSGGFRLLVALWFWFMVLSPVGGGLLGQEIGLWAAVTYFWFGLIFYLFLGSVVLLIPRLLGGGFLLTPLFILLVIGAVGACAWGSARARIPVVKEQTVQTADLAPENEGLRIALISDVHLYSVEAESRLDRILGELAAIDYDLLISAGDLIETGIHDYPWQPLAAKLAALKPRLGKYAVSGNHEYYADMSARTPISEKFHAEAGFRLIDNQIADIEGIVRLVGVPDADYPSYSGAREAEMLGQTKPNLPIILLKHRPDVIPAEIGRFDLMLSGHTHGGQLWPFNHVVKLVFPYIAGYYDLGQGSSLYTSMGSGTWGPPIRVGTAPEITLIRLVREKKGS